MNGVAADSYCEQYNHNNVFDNCGYIIRNKKN